MTLIMIAVLLGWLFAAVGGCLVYQLFLQNGRILRRLAVLERQTVRPVPGPGARPGLAGLSMGVPAPDFGLTGLAGGDKRLSDWRGRRVLLIFFNPRCGFCSQMAPALAALPIDPDGGRPLPIVVTNGTEEENRKLMEAHGVRCPVLLQKEGEIASLYQASGTPMGYLLDQEGRIASSLAVGAEALLGLAGSASIAPEDKVDPVNSEPGHDGHAKQRGNRPLSESRLNRNGLAVGTPAPHFRVPRLDAGELSIEDYRGQRVLLVFSDPHCGPCDALAPRLERAGHERPDVRILMVSRGDADDNRRKVADLGLTFPVGLQRKWEISKLYAMFATPIAYLIDERGQTASEVAVGVEAILALLTCAGSPAGVQRQEAPRASAAVRA